MRFLMLAIVLIFPVVDLVVTARFARWTGVPLWMWLAGSAAMGLWVLANERMAAALAAKGYRYQFVFARNASHCDRTVKEQTLPAALEWLWKE